MTILRADGLLYSVTCFCMYVVLLGEAIKDDAGSVKEHSHQFHAVPFYVILRVPFYGILRVKSFPIGQGVCTAKSGGHTLTSLNFL